MYKNICSKHVQRRRHVLRWGTVGVVGGMLKAFPGPDPLQGCLVWLWHLLLVHCTCSGLLLLTTRLAFSWVSAPLLHPLKTSKYFWLLPVKTSKCLWLIINGQAFSDSSLLHWTERIETYSATTEKSWPISYCLKTQNSPTLILLFLFLHHFIYNFRAFFD